MTIIKTKDLTGTALDWAVAEAQGVQISVVLPNDYPHVLRFKNGNRWENYHPSTNWEQGGAIIQREMLGIMPISDASWRAGDVDGANGFGLTPLEAAMRCHVAAQAGEEVDIPEEVLPAMEEQP